MIRKQIKTVAGALFHDGIDVEKLSIEAKDELRKAVEVLLASSQDCDCGFTSEACKVNHCQRKKIATSGLVPDAKWPDTGK